MMEGQNNDLPDKMSVGVAVLGYGLVLLIVALMFGLAAPVV